MEAIDRYIERLNEPAIREKHRQYHLVGEDGPRWDHCSRATEEAVATVERELGVALPPSYKKLVTTTEPYDNLPIYWVVGPDGASGFIGGTSSDAAPPFLMGILDLPNGDEYCFDTRYPDERGECPIVLYDHEIHSEDSTEFEVVAKDLGEFLLGWLPPPGAGT